MKQRQQSYALGVVAAGLVALLGGCEVLDGGLPEASENASEVPTSRARVMAELREAQRLGLITVGEEDVPVLTTEQAQLIAQAGEQADARSEVAHK